MADDKHDEFILQDGDAVARGELSDDGFVVREGATVRREIDAAAVEAVGPLREVLLEEGGLVVDGGRLRLTEDYVFVSPSCAASIVLGRWVNGWREWALPDGRTLSQERHVVRPAGPLLDASRRQALIDKYTELRDEERVYSESQLEGFYSTFQQKFGPDVLRGMDGESLLTFMHDIANRDSLVFWLEFKSDDEFDTKRFGSIAGGSALKYRIFRRKETGHWQAGGKKNRPVDIPLEEAIEYARAHRDQLLKGVELLEQLSEDATDEDYAELQDRMDELAPDVSSLAWGHKYFSLICPDKVDDFHSPAWQRFHLLKLLQIPPEHKGRYICAGRFVAAAREVEIPIHCFSTTLNALQGSLHRYWRVGTRGGAERTSYWKMMRERNCVAIGWPDLGDLSWVEAKKESKEKLKQLLQKTYANSPSAAGKAATQITHFVATINEGDIVLAADGATVLGVGRISGEYSFEPEFGFSHQRSVEWMSLEEWKMPEFEGLRSTVRELRRHAANIVETERRIQGTDPGPVVPDPIAPIVKRNFQPSGIPGRIQSVLDRKGQVILYGPPGTGKTYWAEKAAFDLAAISAFGRLFEHLTEEQRREITGDGQSNGLVRMCCFHPAYGYEDFLEGYRPHTIDGQVTFELRDGVFKRLCRDAAKDPDRRFYLIVDEINRGDIPRVFGELLTTLEKDKRGKRIVLPVSQEIFSIPKNVFVIGTMNTADRSISLLDAALRRRFGFVEMMPDGKVLKDSSVSGIALRAWFEALNERIRENVGRDARNLQIGHSYLMQAGSPIKEIAVLKRAIRDDIIPLLEEYCYEDYGTLTSILGESLVDAVAQRIRHELFDDGQEESLVQGLLSHYSEISTSSEAIASDESSMDEEPEEGDEDEDADE